MQVSKKINAERNSAFELLRLISQLFIVIYHICYIWQGDKYASTGFFQSIGISLHVGVIIFVLLSGYFTIKASSKGVIKLLGIFIVYDSVEILFNIHNAVSLSSVIAQGLFLTCTHYWFIKTYLFLYLVSPLLNVWIKNSSLKEKWYIIGVLFFVASWMAITGGDPSMENGKNLVNFIFIYLIGNLLREYNNYWVKISSKIILSVYIMLNIFIFSLSYRFHGHIIADVIYKLSYPYSSPVLILNSILLFTLIGKLSIKSKIINYLASSSLAIYLIHASRPIMPYIHSCCTSFLQGISSDYICLFCMYMAYSLIVILFCILIDKLLSPLWKIIDVMGLKCYNKLGY